MWRVYKLLHQTQMKIQDWQVRTFSTGICYCKEPFPRFPGRHKAYVCSCGQVYRWHRALKTWHDHERWGNRKAWFSYDDPKTIPIEEYQQLRQLIGEQHAVIDVVYGSHRKCVCVGCGMVQSVNEPPDLNNLKHKGENCPVERMLDLIGLGD